MEIDNNFLKKRPLSYSSLKAFRRSPVHYIHYLTQPRIETPAMRLGSLVDELLLTPLVVKDKYIIAPKVDKRTKKGKETWASFEAQAKGRVVIDQETMDKANRMVDSVMRHPVAKHLIEGKKKAQVKAKWRDTDTKLPCIGMIDFETEYDDLFIVDLKTGQDADPSVWNRQVVKYEYHLQAGMYLDAYHKSRYLFPTFLHLAVESDQPYGVSVMMFDKDAVEFGKEEFYNTCKAFKYAMDNDQFDMGYEFHLFESAKFHPMRLPTWTPKRFG